MSKPWIGGKRVFAAGGSYGGYMVAWMNGHLERVAATAPTSAMLDASIGLACLLTTPGAGTPRGGGGELGAEYWAGMAKVHTQSLHAFAEGCTTPTLVIHGALYFRAPDAQGLAYCNTLKAQGIDARLLLFPDENHWVLKPRNSKLWYSEVFARLVWHGAANRQRGAKRRKI